MPDSRSRGIYFRFIYQTSNSLQLTKENHAPSGNSTEGRPSRSKSPCHVLSDARFTRAFSPISASKKGLDIVPAAADEVTDVSLGIGPKSNGDGVELCVKQESGVEGQSGLYESGHQKNF